MKKALWTFAVVLLFCTSAPAQDLNTKLLDAAWEGNSAELPGAPGCAFLPGDFGIRAGGSALIPKNAFGWPSLRV